MKYHIRFSQDHAEQIKNLMNKSGDKENIAIILFRSSIYNELIETQEEKNTTFLSREVIEIPSEFIISCNASHITWSTEPFIQALRKLETDKCSAIAIIHSHIGELKDFSTVDDQHESELMKLAYNRNGENFHYISMLHAHDGTIIGRVWTNTLQTISVKSITTIGDQWHKFIHPNFQEPNSISEAFDRQIRTFGPNLQHIFSSLHIGVVGCGGTGSAVAPLLARLGIKKISLFDQDTVEITNLNRLHGAGMKDIGKTKTSVIQSSIMEMGLGTVVNTYNSWINNPVCRDALKSCDVVFGCTDDHAGRLMLNRLAYCYYIPIIDIGLAIQPNEDRTQIRALAGRVSIIQPKTGCLLCAGNINPQLAFAENLKRDNPDEYEARKKENYVIGGNNPNPAVITFTTETATMAVNELINRFYAFRPRFATKQRFFHSDSDITSQPQGLSSCLICNNKDYWGLGDYEPFLQIL